MINLSIHPRHHNGDGEKVNTSKPPKDPRKGILGKRIARLEKRRHDRDLTVSSLKATKGDPNLMFKRPGSMTK